jgi:hypothetical protein
VYDDVPDIFLPIMLDHFLNMVLLTDCKMCASFAISSGMYTTAIQGAISRFEVRSVWLEHQQRNKIFGLYFFLVTCVRVFFYMSVFRRDVWCMAVCKCMCVCAYV